jgi:hypothetical protein
MHRNAVPLKHMASLTATAPIEVALPSTTASADDNPIIYEVQPVEEFVEVILSLIFFNTIWQKC